MCGELWIGSNGFHYEFVIFSSGCCIWCGSLLSKTLYIYKILFYLIIIYLFNLLPMSRDRPSKDDCSRERLWKRNTFYFYLFYHPSYHLSNDMYVEENQGNKIYAISKIHIYIYITLARPHSFHIQEEMNYFIINIIIDHDFW